MSEKDTVRALALLVNPAREVNDHPLGMRKVVQWLRDSGLVVVYSQTALDESPARVTMACPREETGSTVDQVFRLCRLRCLLNYGVYAVFHANDDIVDVELEYVDDDMLRRSDAYAEEVYNARFP